MILWQWAWKRGPCLITWLMLQPKIAKIKRKEVSFAGSLRPSPRDAGEEPRHPAGALMLNPCSLWVGNRRMRLFKMPLGCFYKGISGMTYWDKTWGQTWNKLQGIYILSSLERPFDTPGGVGGQGCREGCQFRPSLSSPRGDKQQNIGLTLWDQFNQNNSW